MSQTITIDLNSHVPVYRQIVDAMRHLLVDGELQPGDQVPTVRQLAIDLGVHFNTVAQAYRLLADEGWLDLKRHRGAKVLDRRKPAAPSAVLRPAAPSTFTRFGFAVRSAGTSPKIVAEPIPASAENANTRQSIWIAFKRGRLAGAITRSS